MGSICITNARIWDGESFGEGDILVADSRILAIRDKALDWKNEEVAKKAQEAEFCYDAGGRIVSPGLVDIHVHMRGISSDQFGIDAQMSCLPFGVTAAADASGGKGNKALLDTFQVKNVIFAAVSFKDNRPDFEQLEKWLALYGDRTVGIKVYFVEDSGVWDTKPLKEVCQFAHERNLRVMVHTTDSLVPMSEVLEALGEGDIFSHAYHGGRYTVAEDDFASLESARRRGVIIDAGMAGHVHTDFGVLKAAIDAGSIPDVISTDITCYSAYKRGGIYGMTMCMSIMHYLGMKEEDIFRAVTGNAAASLGKESQWGYLREGRCADIAVLEYGENGFDMTDKAGNHIESTAGYSCVLTISDGQIVYRR